MKVDLPESTHGFGASREKRELLEYLLAEEGLENPGPNAQPSGDVREIPLSFTQERLWFLDQMDSGNATYNVPSAFELTGPLNVDALHRALNEIVRRHNVLRTTFQARDGRPFQVVAPSHFLELPLFDLRQMPDDAKAAEVRRRLGENAERPFDLARGPLFRASLLRIDEERHALLLCMHHIVSDGWSAVVFFKELNVLFQAFAEGKPSPLPELPIQYADFSISQRERLQGAVLEEQLKYWKQQLAGLVPEPILPTDRPRPPVQTYRGAKRLLEIESALTRKLRELSRAENVTLFMLLLAAFKVLLYRQSGQDHIAVGVPIANRNQIETEELIGFFANTLVLHSVISGNQRFRELLARMRETVVGAIAHEDLPFAMLVDELKPVRSLSHSPLFQIMFTYQKPPSDSFRLGGLKVTRLHHADFNPAKFDITWAVYESGEGLRVSIAYNADLFDPQTMERLGERYRTLLESIVADTSQRLDSLLLLNEAEKRPIPVEWNDTQGNYPAEPGIHQLFEAHAARAPDTEAIVFGAKRWSYRELNRRANQLAHRLRRLGVSTEELVGVCLGRSADLIVALVGILKAGGAYVPLDPTYPRERLAFMLEDSGIRQLVTEHRMLEVLPKYPFQAICLDRDEESISFESSENPPAVSAGENAAYVMYTSGSTGRPKGVVITHKAVTSLVVSTDYVQLKTTDVVAQVSNASFDAMTFEVWGALLNGARMVGISTDILLSAKALAAELREHRITAMFLTAALFDHLVREDPSLFQTLEHLLFGGEAATPENVRAVLMRGAPRRLLNAYGPTETTTFASYYLVEDVPENATTVPIGRPIKNCQLYILDDRLQLLPQSAAGELYIGGGGLARGYLNRPDLTAERFVPNPFSSHPGSRLYKSGDLARYRADGAIELLGRLDHQIKLRGFRIEPGEIEEALRQHPDVRQAAVLAHEDGPGNKYLAAFVVSRKHREPTAIELRRWVQPRLPGYMRPADFVLLKDFPLTANGKVDRRALLDLLSLPPTLEGAYMPPGDELEVQLTSAWQRVLNRPSVSIQDNFFELGGHSLLAVRLIAEIERATGKRLSLAAIFQAPTIQELALLLRRDGHPFRPAGFEPAEQTAGTRQSLTSGSSLLALRPEGSKPPFFWIHGENSNPLLPRYLDADQPVYGLEHQSVDGTEARCRTVEEIAHLYLAEMRTVQPNGPYFIGGYCFGGSVAWEIAQRLKRDGEGVKLLALLEPALNLPGAEGSSAPKLDQSSDHKFSLRVQLGNLRGLNARQQWSYVWSRVHNKLSEYLRIPRPVKDITKAFVCTAFLRLGYRIPYSLRSFYILRLYNRALEKYTAQIYPGSVLVFVSAGSADPAGWSRLATGDVTLFEIPADHMEIRKGPFVQAWAEELRDSLRAAQTERPISSTRSSVLERETTYVADSEAKRIFKSDESCTSNPKSEIADWTSRS